MSNSDYYLNEESVINGIKFLIDNAEYVFQFIVEDSENYIPNFNFEYEIYDCQIKESLVHKNSWEKIFSLNKPIVFTNTSHMFESFENDSTKNGVIEWTRYFYENYYQRVCHCKYKLIFLINTENIKKICSNVKGNFLIDCMPIFLNKDVIYKKTLKNIE